VGFFKRKSEELPWVWPRPESPSVGPAVASQSYPTNTFGSQFDGEQFWGGITGIVDDISSLDYWTLRARSASLFRTNSYAQGIVRRLVTNVIHKGIFPKFDPEETIIGLNEDALIDWSDDVGIKFRLYCESKHAIDEKGRRTFGELQGQAYQEAIIAGDCLVINRQSKRGVPRYQLVSGNRVQTPLDKWGDPNVIDGVVVDDNGRHLGYYVYLGTDDKPNNEYMYVPAFGKQSGRKIAWMVYSPITREDDVRGTPLLSVAIQPLNEILKYRGSAQLKAEISARITAFISRDQEQAKGISAVGKSAARRDTVQADPTGSTKSTIVDRIMPGMIITKLNPGDKPVMYSHGTDVNFGQFETAIIAGLSWSFEIPPECLILSYSSNFSASQAALREFNMFLERERDRFSLQFCQPISDDWFISMVLLGRIVATGFLDAYYSGDYETVKAWTAIDWIGSIKPSLKINEEVAAHHDMVADGWTTNTRAARALTGTSYDRNIRKIAKENQMKADAIRPLLELEKEFGQKNVESVMKRTPMLSIAPIDDAENA